MSSTDRINPLGNIYQQFQYILENITIKRTTEAEQFETMEIRTRAYEYIDAVAKKDSFETYYDYTELEFNQVGFYDKILIDEIIENGNMDLIPKRFKQPLLELRRVKIIDTFEEQNNYYRRYYGLPDLEDTEFFYPTKSMETVYGIDHTIPIHKVQDHYNKISSGQGDYFISLIVNSSYYSNLMEEHPDKVYLHYMGANRIPISISRNALQFQIMQLNRGGIDNHIYELWLQYYEQCREYFMKCLYVPDMRSFVDHYDDFIGMSIFLMTELQILMRQITSGVRRDFFDAAAIRSLYEAYGLPYNLGIDEETQSKILQNLNMIIRKKATNKNLYNIAEILGFANLDIYKYYLSKERKFDRYGTPLVRYTTKFNNDTGEVDTVEDVDYMYDMYFQKEKLTNNDLVRTFNIKSNREEYDRVISDDPFWIEDNKLTSMIWDAEYNFVESKYLGLGVSYSLTQILMENIILLNLLLDKRDELSGIYTTLPRISGNLEIPLFDIVILLVCLTASKHNLTGEILTVPTQLISVLDYINNVEDTSYAVDTLHFNFKYFLDPTTQAQERIKLLKRQLGDDAYNEFISYITTMELNETGSVKERLNSINELFTNVKHIRKFLAYHMTATSDRQTYKNLKCMYDSIFYGKHMKELFTIDNEYLETERTAWTYYEFLYHINPALYKCVYQFDADTSWRDYLKEHGMTENELSFEEYMIQVELGNIKINYGKLLDTIDGSEKTKDEVIYYYVNHIISRMSYLLNNINFLYLMNDSSTPLEELLVKLIRFFKSFTVDIISFDTIILIDTKPESTMRLFEEIYYMYKYIEPKEYQKFSYGDIIKHMRAEFSISDAMILRDQLFHDVIIRLGKYKSDNHMYMSDMLFYLQKEIAMKENFDLFDLMMIRSYLSSDDRLNWKESNHYYISNLGLEEHSLKMRDTVTLSWES